MYKFSVIIPEAPNIPKNEKVHLGLEAMPHNIDVFQTFDIMVLMKTHAALGDVLMRGVQISDCHIIQVTNLFLCEM